MLKYWQFGRVAVALTPIIALTLAVPVQAQQSEAETGFGLTGTFSALATASTELEAAPRDGGLVGSGFRLMLYPTWKISRHWAVGGAWQLASRPYYYSEFTTQNYGVRGSVAQGYLSYSQVWNDASVLVRVGELSSAFGAFPLHYDDHDNFLVDVPMQYGYYGAVATLSALAGAEIDTTWKKFDARAQFVNSSPANPRSVFATEQYGNWVGGAGYTIRQGLRIGISGYRGPYLDRQSQFYNPIEGRPRSMPATGTSLEAQWGRGHWNIRGELQRFAMTYGPVPTFHDRVGYVEAQRELSPHWYAAARFGYMSADYIGQVQEIEAVAGYRLAPGQIVKLSYETTHSEFVNYPNRTLSLQFVMAIHPLAFAGH